MNTTGGVAMAAPDPPAAALATMERHTGIDRGELAAAIVTVLGYIDRLAYEWQVMRGHCKRADARADDADRRIHDLAVQVQVALDDTHPDQAGAFVRFMAAVNELPAVTAARTTPADRTPA